MRPIRWLLAGLVVAMALHGCSRDEPSQASQPGQLRVMTFSIGRSDEPANLDQVAAAIRTAGADIVGLQDSDGNERRIAEILGWNFADEQLHLVSRFPLYPLQRDGVSLAYAEVSAGHVVAIANVQFPLDRDGSEQDLAMQRMMTLKQISKALPELASEKVPTFLTGTFSMRSHLDQPKASADISVPTFQQRVELHASKALADSGLIDSYRAIHADPVANPGITWIHPTSQAGGETPGGTPSRVDFVYSGGPAKVIDSKTIGESGKDSGKADIVVDAWPSDHRAVVSTFEIDPAPMPYMVIVDPATVQPGDLITVRVATQKRENKGVVGIFRADKPELQAITSQPPQDGDQLTATFGTVRLRPGRYIAVYADSAGKRLAGTEFEVRPAQKPRIQVTNALVKPGDPIEVAWREAAGNKLDWIGLYKADEPNLSAYLARIDIDAAIRGQTAFTFKSPGDNLQPGKYEVRLMQAGSYIELANAKFIVSNPNAKPQVIVPVRVNEGDQVTVSWKDSPGNDRDYIGIYKADETDLHRYITYLYTDGKIDGSVTFKPAKFAKTPGEYVARLMINDGYKELASARFWVGSADGKPLVSVKTRINPGEPIEVKWMSAPPGQRVLIRIHRADDANFSQILSEHLDSAGATDGQYVFKTEALEPGNYKVRMMREDGSEELASTQFTVPDPKAGPQVSAPASPVKAGEPLVISWKNSPGNQRDWIGLFKAGTTNTHQYITWLYTDGAVDGSVTFGADKTRSLAPGEYRAGLLVNDGYDEIASTTFTVAGSVRQPTAPLDHAIALPCDLPKPGSNQLLAVLGASRGELQPNVTVAGQDATTGLMLVKIEPGEQPLYLFLISQKPMIWHLQGATNRIARVVAVRSDDKILETEGVGVVGVRSDKVTLLQPNSCGRYFTDSQTQEAMALGQAIEQSVGRHPDTMNAVLSAKMIAMPSGTVIAKNKIQHLVITGDQQISVQGSNFTVVRGDSVADLITLENYYAPWNSLISIDPLAVVTADKAEPYDVLPGAYGLRQLVEAGQLQRTDDGYRIVKPISRFPASLTGTGTDTFILPTGVPMPAGDATGLKIITEQTAQ
jgi:exonuclease III